MPPIPGAICRAICLGEGSTCFPHGSLLHPYRGESRIKHWTTPPCQQLCFSIFKSYINQQHRDTGNCLQRVVVARWYLMRRNGCRGCPSVSETPSSSRHKTSKTTPVSDRFSDPPDSITISDFMTTDKYGRCPIARSRNPFTCGLTGKTFTVPELNERR